jgi:hypothetical protein
MNTSSTRSTAYQRRPVNCGCEGAIPARCVHSDGLKTPRSPPGSRSSRGGLPRPSGRRKVCCTAERVDLNDPPISRTTCSDVVRVRCGDHEVSGRRRAGAQSSHTSFRRAWQSILDSLAPDRRAIPFARAGLARRSYSLAGHRCSGDAPLPKREGALRRRSNAAARTKARERERDWAPKP